MVKPVPTLHGNRINQGWRVYPRRTVRRDFPTREAAQKYADLINRSRGTTDEGFWMLEAVDRKHLMVAMEAVNGDSKLLQQLAFTHMKRQIIGQSVTVQRAVHEMICDQQRRNCRERSWQNTEKFGKWFGRGSDVVSSVTEGDVMRWVDGIKTPAMRNWGVRYVRLFFKFCYRREWIAVNPADKLQDVILAARAPVILTVENAQKLMRTAEEYDKEIVPYLALRLFGGIRRSECADIGWLHIKPRFVEVRSEIAKCRAQRLVTVTDCLKAWLAVGGTLPPDRIGTRIADCAELCDVKMDQNVLRHSFISYAVPTFGAARTAAEAGNSEGMIFKWYRQLVTYEEAEAFWALRPLVSSLPAHLQHLGVQSDAVLA